ncbi:Hypothetical predicted protein [Mytilus galloprovincialis]|uniref:Dynein heavy chain coiled coil stalk domain-containing protein n=1 Tax=Mytilus galloprovincialis TaxID=29158 RepID=A0A8B6CI07_MYTGA|nr:Hypothetical predicted protein [Mytilus galloprovincialis]
MATQENDSTDIEVVLKDLKKINKGSLTELKSFTKPPQLVKMVMEAVCILLNRTPSWEQSKKLLSDVNNFMQQIQNYDKDNISPEVITKIRNEYTSDPEFSVEKAKNVSMAIWKLCSWPKRGCKEYKCELLISQSKNITELPEPETRGLFVIKEFNVVIYIGQSQDCLRERMLSHLGGYDAQDIGEYLKDMDSDEKERNISIAWVEIMRPRCDEHHYIKCIEKRQGKWPKFNRKRGRPKKTPYSAKS